MGKRQHYTNIIQIEDYIQDKYVAAKLPEQYLEVIFNAEETPDLKLSTDESQSQLRCSNLVFPFARSPVAEVELKNACVLVAHNEAVNVKKVTQLTFNTTNLLCDDVQPGDTIAILPRNTPKDVELVLTAIKLHKFADTNCLVQLRSDCTKKSAKVPSYIPTRGVTPRQLLRDCLSLRAVPKKLFLRALAACCSDAQEQHFLCSLSAKEGSHFYNKLMLEKGYQLLDVLRACPTCSPSLSLIIEHLPRLLPRPYSIASSPLAAADEVKIIYSLLPENAGVTSELLDNLATQLLEQPKQQLCVPIYFRVTNQFRFSSEVMAMNTILIGVGTGVAPFLSFLEHKSLIQKQNTVCLGKTWLFAGARTQSSAFGRQRFNEFKASAVLDKYFEAFSRDDTCSFKYVQQLLLDNCAALVEFVMQPNTCVFVCADGAQISKSIEMGIQQCLEQSLALEEPAQAAELIKEWRNSGKYREELWA